jgi:phosphate transport system substrate-binding protein
MKEAEGEKLRTRFNTTGMEIPVARDGVTFYVNEANPVGALTKEQLQGIYLGDITNWKQVGSPDAPIIVYSRESSSGTYVFMKDSLLNGEDLTSSAQTLPGTAAVVNAVAKEKFGIGYGGAAYAKGVRELKIKKGSEEIAPDAKSIASGKYPLSRDLFFYTRNKPAGEVKAFVDFALSAEGQAIVNTVGYFPVK